MARRREEEDGRQIEARIAKGKRKPDARADWLAGLSKQGKGITMFRTYYHVTMHVTSDLVTHYQSRDSAFPTGHLRVSSDSTVPFSALDVAFFLAFGSLAVGPTCHPVDTAQL